MGGAALLGAVLTGQAVAKNSKNPGSASWYQGSGRYLTFDVDLAVLGYTNADNPDGAISSAPSGPGGVGLDTRGIIQYYEGVLYPGGSIPELPQGQPDNPASSSSITWLLNLPVNSPQVNAGLDCVSNSGVPAAYGLATGEAVAAAGTFTNQANIIINRPCRANPHFISEHHYYLSGELGNNNLSPVDMLTSSGTENGTPPGDDVLRAVLGGTGYFKFARGQVTQRRLGRNNSRIRGLGAPGSEPLAPNYRFTFELALW